MELKQLTWTLMIFSMARIIYGDKKKESQCFNCQSSLGKMCSDPFHVTGVDVIPCSGNCVKIKIEDYNEHIIFRYCLQSDEDVKEGCFTKEDGHGAKQIECYCFGNLCNGGVGFTQRWSSIMFITFFGVLHYL